MRLKDKVALVTGVDAGSIGQATALILAEAGVTVAVVGGGDKDGIETVALIRKGGGNALPLSLDIAKERDAKQACEDTIRAFGKLDILVNNDAVFVPRGLEPPLEDWQNSSKIIGGTALISRYAAQAMKQQQKGAIVNIVTLSGPRTRSTTYSSTAATLMQMTRDMAVDLAPDNIRVNCVCHGNVRSVTPVENTGTADQTAKEPRAVEGLNHLLIRTGKPSDVAYAILFLASDEASFITGTHLFVDGGHYSTAISGFQQNISSRVASFS